MGIKNREVVCQNYDLQRTETHLYGEDLWEARKEFVLPRELFEFQMECAKVIASKTGEPIETVIDTYAPFLRPEMWEHRKSYDSSTFNPLPSVENVVEAAFESYQKSISDVPISYNNGTRYGCFSYDKTTESTVKIHFVNAEFDEVGPLSQSKINQRKAELTDLFTQIKKDRPETTEVNGASWLYNLEAYRRLFPSQYTETRVPDNDPNSWKIGTKIWGQFLGSDYKLKSEQAEKFLAQIQKIPEGLDQKKLPSELLSSLPNPPLKVSAPISEFYNFYGIK